MAAPLGAGTAVVVVAGITEGVVRDAAVKSDFSWDNIEIEVGDQQELRRKATTMMIMRHPNGFSPAPPPLPGLRWTTIHSSFRALIWRRFRDMVFVVLAGFGLTNAYRRGWVSTADVWRRPGREKVVALVTGEKTLRDIVLR